MADPPFHLVLLHPEIPNNTGNIGRTAAATGCRLHLVHPLGFEMTEKARRRAGLDYWDLVDCREHADWDAFLATERPGRLWLYTTHSTRPHHTLLRATSAVVAVARVARTICRRTLSWRTVTKATQDVTRLVLFGDLPT